jgi:hypothetical protein
MGQADIPLPIVFVGAGLPSLPAQLADATSYAERLYDYRPIGLLDATGAAAALTGPTLAQGVHLGTGRSAGRPGHRRWISVLLAGGRQARVGRGTLEHLQPR